MNLIGFVGCAVVAFSLLKITTVQALTVDEAKRLDANLLENILPDKPLTMTTFASGAYVGGIVDALARSEELAGNGQRASCIWAWYHGGGGGPTQVAQVFNDSRFANREGYDVLKAMTRRNCPDELDAPPSAQ